MTRFLAIALVVLLSPALAMAQEGLEDIMGGFDEAAPTVVTPQAPPEAPSKWDLSGSLGLSTVYNVGHNKTAPGVQDHRGLSRARTKLNLKLKGQLSEDWRVQSDAYVFYDAAYRMNGRDGYPPQVVDDQARDAQLGELYLQGSVTPDLDVKLGRQIVVWGTSDTIRITDVLNPMDLREPGMADIEDLRLPLSMARGDYYFGNWSVSGIVIPEIKFDRLAAYGSDYHIPAFHSGVEDKPGSGLGKAEVGAALNGAFSGWDMSLYAANYFSDAPTKNGTVYRHARLNMLGGAVNVAAGNWLLKGEAAVQDGLRFQNLPQNSYTRGDLLIGADYSGFTDTTLTFEVADRHLFSYDSSLGAGTTRDDWQWALRYDATFMHERLHVSALQSMVGVKWKGGGYTRVSVAYDLQDALILTGGAVIYQDGTHTPYNVIGDNDRLFAELKWSF